MVDNVLVSLEVGYQMYQMLLLAGLLLDVNCSVWNVQLLHIKSLELQLGDSCDVREMFRPHFLFPY